MNDKKWALSHGKFDLGQINGFEEFKNAEREREAKYLEHVEKAKAFLAQIFIFTPDKAKITEMVITNPYEDKIKFCEDLIKDLSEIYCTYQNDKDTTDQHITKAVGLLWEPGRKHKSCALDKDRYEGKKARYSGNN